MIKRILKITALILTAVVLIAGIAIGAAYVHSRNYSIPEQACSIGNTTGLVQASGRSLYDANGDRLQLKGINAGQILLQEGWMSPFALEPSRNPDGSFVKDKDGNIQYPDFAEEDFRAGLKANPNLADYDLDELMQYYWDCCFTEEDFRIIREELKLNTIRLPFYYLNILNEDLTLKSEEEAFSYLDWFISQAAQHQLYIVLDLHGAPGSQNGYEHSGTSRQISGLWESEKNIQATVDLWDFVSRHYTETRPDLGRWIASYDLLNEPTFGHKGSTTQECWVVFDRIYDAIRANGDRHVITMMGCWEFDNLPDPTQFGWENIQYQYHWYNWWSDKLPTKLLYAYFDLYNLGRDYDVPVYIGEFTLFEDKEEWADTLELYDRRNYSWTIWNYKTTITGWWTSSWGVYTCQLKLAPETEALKCNVSTCTYEEYIAACEQMRTENCVISTLWEVLETYNRK